MKKVAFSVIATGSLALFAGTGDAEASSYKVKAGDSLWKIASENNVSLSNLKQLNGLTSDVIYPNQVLQLASTTANPPASNKPADNNNAKPGTGASTSTYTVKPGDTLARIASQHKTTVGAIQRLNNIPSHLIFPGQVLKVSGTVQAPSTPKPPATNPSTPPPASAGGTYRVASGDTLSAIAYRQGISVTQLKNWNNLNSNLIYVGQVLKVKNNVVETQPNPPPVVTTPPPAQSASGTAKNIVSQAMALQGIPYVWGGSTTSGFDCSGFLYYVYNKAGVKIPRTNTVGYDARSYEVSKPQVGDLVFFKNTYQAGISHAGIYIGDNKFIHAGGDRVQVTSLSDSYWKKHFDSYKRLYAMD